MPGSCTICYFNTKKVRLKHVPKVKLRVLPPNFNTKKVRLKLFTMNT